MTLMADKNDSAPQYAAAQGLNGTRGWICTQCGIGTLSNGTATISGAWSLTAQSVVLCFRKSTSGVPGAAFAETNSGRTPGTSFVVIAGTLADPIVATATDQGTFNWFIFNPVFHADITPVSFTGDPRSPTSVAGIITAATAADLPTCLTMAGQIAVLYPLHLADTQAHRAADVTNSPLANATPVDLATLITWLNDVKSKLNAHLILATSFYNTDTTNTVSASNASDLATSITLINAIKTSFNAHVQSAPRGEGVKLIGP